MRQVKPTVDKIFDAGNVDDQATLICAVVDNPALVAARALAGILGMPWLLCVDMYEQPRYAANNQCVLWRSFKGANDWKIVQCEQAIRCMLNTLEAWMTLMLMIRKGVVGAVGTTDEAAMGYYIVQWKSKPYALQVDAEGILGIVMAVLDSGKRMSVRK